MVGITLDIKRVRGKFGFFTLVLPALPWTCLLPRPPLSGGDWSICLVIKVKLFRFHLSSESTFSCVKMHCAATAARDAEGPSFAHMVSFCWIESDGSSFTTSYVCSSCGQFTLASSSLSGNWQILICTSVPSVKPQMKILFQRMSESGNIFIKTCQKDTQACNYFLI